MEELLTNINQFNLIYEKLFYLFMNGLKRKHKRTYYKFSFKDKVYSGRCILPEVKVNLEETRIRALELFRYEYPECKFYSNPLIEQVFPDVLNDLYESLSREDFQSEAESAIDKLVDEVIKKKL